LLVLQGGNPVAGFDTLFPSLSRRPSVVNLPWHCSQICFRQYFLPFSPLSIQGKTEMTAGFIIEIIYLTYINKFIKSDGLQSRVSGAHTAEE
jgi:hypothetical protein